MQKNILIFTIFIPVALLLVAGLSLFVLHVVSKITTIPYLSLPFIIFPALLLITTILGNVSSSRINDIIYTISIFWIPVLLYLFLGSLIIELLSLFSIPLFILQSIAVLLGLIMTGTLAYGVWNATHPEIKKYSINAPLLKEKWGGKKIVLISDIHLGMVTKASWVRKIAGMINTVGADIVLIAGDLADGPKFDYKKDLAPLGEIKSTYGIFYSAGNHDEYNPDQDAYYAELEKYVTVLNDKKTVVNNTQIVGIMYAYDGVAETKARLFATGYQKEIPSIGLLHDPKNIAAFAQEGVTLGLSGHTHAGQFFPFTLVVKSIYKDLTKGIHYIGNMAHITSVGIGTAGPRLRIGMTPEVALIEIQ